MIKNALLIIICLLICGCQQNAKNASNKKTIDSLNRANGNDSSLLAYADEITGIKESMEKTESPNYDTGDYSFYVVSYTNGGSIVLLEEFGDAGDYGFSNKQFFFKDGQLIFYHDFEKQTNLSKTAPENTFSETRIFYRNDVFLKADQRKANAEDALKSLPFTANENIEKNQQATLRKLQNALAKTGDYELFFNRIDSVRRKAYLVLESASGNISSNFLIKTPDSLINQLNLEPGFFKGKKIEPEYSRSGNEMIYKSAKIQP